MLNSARNQSPEHQRVGIRGTAARKQPTRPTQSRERKRPVFTVAALLLPRSGGTATALGGHALTGVGQVARSDPPHGFDLPICWWKTTTSLPCPGCGLMRSLSCTVLGMLGPAWLAVVSGGAAVRLLSAGSQRRVRAWAGRHSRLIGAAYAALLAAFLAYGVLRAAIDALSG